MRLRHRGCAKATPKRASAVHPVGAFSRWGSLSGPRDRDLSAAWGRGEGGGRRALGQPARRLSRGAEGAHGAPTQGPPGGVTATSAIGWAKTFFCRIARFPPPRCPLPRTRPARPRNAIGGSGGLSPCRPDEGRLLAPPDSGKGILKGAAEGADHGARGSGREEGGRPSPSVAATTLQHRRRSP